MGSISDSVAIARCRLCGIGSTRENMLRFCRPSAVDFAEQVANAPEVVQGGSGSDLRAADTAIWVMALSRHPKSKPLRSKQGLAPARADDLSNYLSFLPLGRTPSWASWTRRFAVVVVQHAPLVESASTSLICSRLAIFCWTAANWIFTTLFACAD